MRVCTTQFLLAFIYCEKSVEEFQPCSTFVYFAIERKGLYVRNSLTSQRWLVLHEVCKTKLSLA